MSPERSAGSHRLHGDDEATAWSVRQNCGSPSAVWLIGSSTPADNDLTPIGLAVRGAAARVSNLLVERDIYYRAESKFNSGRQGQYRWALTESLTTPSSWSELYLAGALEFDQLDLPIGPDHYLALGDNSPRSSDSRLRAAVVLDS